MLRNKLAEKKKNKDLIKWRGHEVTRIEAFSDAVFAFAVTLLIVALEVPENYEELMETMRMFFPFAVTFMMLFGIWNTQNLFFRRYGLHDTRTLWLNGALLFTTLFYVYPVKFLFSGWLGGKNLHIETAEQFGALFVIYSGGFTIIYLLFFLMYKNAYRQRRELQLSDAEVFETKTKMYMQFFIASGGMLAVLVALMPGQMPLMAGFGYIIIWPLTGIWTKKRDKMFRRQFPHLHHEDVLAVDEEIKLGTAETENS